MIGLHGLFQPEWFFSIICLLWTRMGLNLCPNSEFFCVKLWCLEEMNVISVCAGLSACCGNLVCGAPTHKSLEFFLKSWICVRRGWWTVKNSTGIKNSFIRTGHHSREICGSWMLVQEIWKLGEEEGKNEFWHRRCVRSCRWSWQSSVQEIQEKSLRNPGAVGRAEPGRDGTFHCREEQPQVRNSQPREVVQCLNSCPRMVKGAVKSRVSPHHTWLIFNISAFKSGGSCTGAALKEEGAQSPVMDSVHPNSSGWEKKKIWIDSFQLVLNP